MVRILVFARIQQGLDLGTIEVVSREECVPCLPAPVKRSQHHTITDQHPLEVELTPRYHLLLML